MAHARISFRDVLSAALASVILGALMGGAICLAILGFGSGHFCRRSLLAAV
jgi:hypothetical protein